MHTPVLVLQENQHEREHGPSLTTRRGIPAKYKQPFVAQSEVTFTQPHFNNCHLNRYRHRHRAAPLRSQKYMPLRQSGGWARGSVTQALIRQCRYKTHRRRHSCRLRDNTQQTHQYTQICLPWHLWVLFHMLLISTLPNSCSGACANAPHES